eukprot:6410149-Pyramimonas_sp.AAC.1
MNREEVSGETALPVSAIRSTNAVNNFPAMANRTKVSNENIVLASASNSNLVPNDPVVVLNREEV